MQKILMISSALFIACGGQDGSGAGPNGTPNPRALEEVSDQVPPTSATELFSFLTGSEYNDYIAETSVHASAGPHGRVRVFLNRRLAQSLMAGAESHPVGAAAVKELYQGNDLYGWAVEVKVANGAGGDGWYWYENVSLTEDDPVVDGTGVGVCTDCHDAGTDFVTIGTDGFDL